MDIVALKRQGHSYRQYQDPITDTYHAFNFDKYGYRYLGEHQYRFNRRFDLAAMFQRLCSSAARTGKRPEFCLRLAFSDD